MKFWIRAQSWEMQRSKPSNIRVNFFGLRFGIQFNRNYITLEKADYPTYLGARVVIETPFRFINIGNNVLGQIAFYIPSIYTLERALYTNNKKRTIKAFFRELKYARTY